MKKNDEETLSYKDWMGLDNDEVNVRLESMPLKITTQDIVAQFRLHYRCLQKLH